MLTLVVLKGPEAGREVTLEANPAVIGRDPGVNICFASKAVSRRHAQILCQDGAYFIEDLGSSNGTYLNDRRLSERMPLTERDQLRIGEYVVALRQPVSPSSASTLVETEQVVRERLDANASNPTLYSLNPAQKLQVVLDLSQHLSVTPEQGPLLDKLLDFLLRLLPRADRGMVVLCEQDRLIVRAQRSRHGDKDADYPFSRTIFNQALKDGVGILSADVQADSRFAATATLAAMEAHSLLCVPLIGHDGRRLGALQLDCSRPGTSFEEEDLHLLTTVALQVAVVLENVALNAQRVREAELQRELAMARDIQQNFLPTDFSPLPGGAYELFARVCPARDVSGDLYDFFPLANGQLAFFLGDVSGKGMPAALFGFAVHSLSRHLAASASTPADTLERLNRAVATDNPSAMFVTLMHGTYDPKTGEIVLANCGHPMPLLRRANGTVDEVAMRNGLLLGCVEGPLALEDTTLTLAPGETLILYTDGFPEAFAPDGTTMFGLARLKQALGGACAQLPLAACAEEARKAVIQFTHSAVLQDDLTLLMLRRLR